MEEYYRRKRLSPAHSRIAPYIDILERESTITALRREIQESRGMESRFESLCIEVVKAERENKRLEETHAALEQEYLEKIKQNKGIIHQSKAELDIQLENILQKNAKIESIRNQNDDLLRNYDETKKKLDLNTKDKEVVDQQLLTCAENKKCLENTLKELVEKTNKIQGETSRKSRQVNDKYQEYKLKLIKMAEEEKNHIFLQQQLAEVTQESSKVESFHKLSESRLNLLNCQLSSQSEETLKAKMDSQKQQGEIDQSLAEVHHVSNDLRRALLKNKENSLRVQGISEILLACTKNIHSEDINFEKMNSKCNQMKESNEKMARVLKNISQHLNDEQEAYVSMIEQMKQSIASDEIVISNLTKQSEILEKITS